MSLQRENARSAKVKESRLVVEINIHFLTTPGKLQTVDIECFCAIKRVSFSCTERAYLIHMILSFLFRQYSHAGI